MVERKKTIDKDDDLSSILNSIQNIKFDIDISENDFQNTSKSDNHNLSSEKQRSSVDSQSPLDEFDLKLQNSLEKEKNFQIDNQNTEKPPMRNSSNLINTNKTSPEFKENPIKNHINPPIRTKKMTKNMMAPKKVANLNNNQRMLSKSSGQISSLINKFQK